MLSRINHQLQYSILVVLIYVVSLVTCVSSVSSINSARRHNNGAVLRGQASEPAPPPLELVLLTNVSVDATCLDGTPAGFYWRPANPNSTNANKWVIGIEGGGECVGKKDCYWRSLTDLGSSKNYPATIPDVFQLQSGYASINPDFYDANHAYIKYCTGDLWLGQRTTPSPDVGFKFTGHIIIGAVMDILKESYGAGSSDDIIVWTGDSAGGIGCVANVDYVASYFPQSRVVGVAVAGFYHTSMQYTGPDAINPAPYPFTSTSWDSFADMWDIVVPTDCFEKRPAGTSGWLCALANYSFPYIKSDMFFAQAQTDYVAMWLHGGLPIEPKNVTGEALTFIQHWAAVLATTLEQVIEAPSSGLFNPACYTHTDFQFSRPKINGVDFITAVGNWIFSRPGTNRLLVDKLPLFGNPTCPPWPTK